MDFSEVSLRLKPHGAVRHNDFVLKFWPEPYEMTLFPDGRAIIKGTTDTAWPQLAVVGAVRESVTLPLRAISLFEAIPAVGRDLPSFGGRTYWQPPDAASLLKVSSQPCTRVALPSRTLRSSRFSIFPVPVLGSGPSTNFTRRGILNLAIRGFRKDINVLRLSC